MNVTSLIAEIRYHLNDIEKLGYSDKLLKEFIRDGLCLIVKLAPQDFTKRHIFKANIGSVQCLNSCCQTLISVDAQTDACGNILQGVKLGHIKHAFNKKSVKRKQFTVEIRENVKGSFDVSPAIKEDEDIYFLITCVEQPSLKDRLPNCVYHQALLHYALYRAYGIESESQTSMALSSQEYTRFYQLLSGVRAIEKQMDGRVNN